MHSHSDSSTPSACSGYFLETVSILFTSLEKGKGTTGQGKIVTWFVLLYDQNASIAASPPASYHTPFLEMNPILR